MRTIASQAQGIEELADAIRGYQSYLQRENLVLKRHIQHWKERLLEMLRDELMRNARARLSDGDLARYAAEVAEHKRDPYTVVEEIMAFEGNGRPKKL